MAKFTIEHSDEWGLIGDKVDDHRRLLLNDTLIQSPYNDDSFEFFTGLTIPLKGSKELEWSINGKIIGFAKNLKFQPDSSANYEISAFDKEANRREIIQISVTNP